MALQQGIRIHQYLDDWLVRANSYQLCLQHTKVLVVLCQKLGWIVNMEKSGLEPKQVFDFVGYQFDLIVGKVRPTLDRWQTLTAKITVTIRSGLSGPETDVPYWSINSYRKAGPSRPPTHATHSVASQEQLEGSRINGQSYPYPQIPPPSSKMVAGGEQCAQRSTITPTKTCSSAVYRRLKRRLGHSLKRTHCKRRLVAPRKGVTHKYFGAEGGIFSLKKVPKSLSKQCHSDSHRQHHSGGLCKQGRRHEIRTSVCPSLEDYDLVCQKSGHPQSSPHPRSPECGSRQSFQIGPNNSNRMVSPSPNFSDNLQQVDRSVCNKIQQQINPVCITSARSSGLGSRCTQPVLGKSGPICLPTDSHLGQSGGKATKRTVQEAHSDCSRVAKHALVLGSSDHVQSNSTESAQSADTALQSDSSQESDQPKSPCMAPRASAIKEQGFSEAVAARIEAPQRSTRSVYEAKWTIFTKCCISYKVDFRAPPVKSVADFLMYLFQDRKLQPSTIDGYRSAIADKLGNTFAQFYLKDVAWADSELYHLGPVVAAQQIHKYLDIEKILYICK